MYNRINLNLVGGPLVIDQTQPNVRYATAHCYHCMDKNNDLQVKKMVSFFCTPTPHFIYLCF